MEPLESSVFWDLLKESGIWSAHPGFFSSIWPVVEFTAALVFFVLIWICRWKDIRPLGSTWWKEDVPGLAKAIRGRLSTLFNTAGSSGAARVVNAPDTGGHQLAGGCLDVFARLALPSSTLFSLFGVAAMVIVARFPHWLIWVVTGAQSIYQLDPNGVNLIAKFLALAFWLGHLATLSLALAGIGTLLWYKLSSDEQLQAEEAVEDLPDEQLQAEETVEDLPGELQQAEETVKDLPDEQLQAEEAVEDLPGELQQAEETVEDLPDELQQAEELKREYDERRGRIAEG
jgi:hypothetical protein